MDVQGLKGGEEFPTVIQGEIERADVLIALIGPSWLTAKDEVARPRIEDPNDYVRRELEAAFAAGVEVVPVLVWGARMPSEDGLPEVIRPLCLRQAVELTDRRWRADVITLIETLRKLSWNRKEHQGSQMASSTRVVAEFDLSESVSTDDFDDTGALLARDGHILLASPRGRCLWFVESEKQKVMGKARLRRWPLWKPVAAATGLGHVWVADAWGRAIWRMKPSSGISHVTSGSDEVGWIESIEYDKPTLGSVKGGWIGARPLSVAADALSPGTEAAVWVVVPAPWPQQRGRGGELLRLDPNTLRIVAAISMPKPRRVAVGAGAVWVAAADLLVKVDVSRNVVAQTIPLGFEARGLVVGDDTVWVGGEKGVTRVDAVTCHVEGQIDTPTLFCDRLALSGNDLWVASLDTVHRINTRTHDLVGSVDVSPGVRARIRDIAADEAKVYVAVCNVMNRSFISVIDANAHDQS
jgi:hypothetical protein